jgi:hypothetical protein
MFLGRPTNIWLGAFTAVLGAIVLVLAALQPPIVIPGTVVGALGIAFGAVIGLVANQPPTLNPGQTFNVTTPAGQPSFVTTVATPPAADPAPTPTPDPGPVPGQPITPKPAASTPPTPKV